MNELNHVIVLMAFICLWLSLIPERFVKLPSETRNDLAWFASGLLAVFESRIEAEWIASFAWATIACLAILTSVTSLVLSGLILIFKTEKAE